MIYKKRLALFLVISMSLSMNLNLYASESDKITEIQEANVDSDINKLGTEGYLHAVYSLDAAGNYESTGKKTAYMQKSDGTYTTVEIGDVGFFSKDYSEHGVKEGYWWGEFGGLNYFGVNLEYQDDVRQVFKCTVSSDATSYDHLECYIPQVPLSGVSELSNSSLLKASDYFILGWRSKEELGLKVNPIKKDICG